VPFCFTKQRLRACERPRDRERLRKNAHVKSKVKTTPAGARMPAGIVLLSNIL
jgi:hypothetical protein